MATVLKNTLVFTGVAAAGQATLAHQLNSRGTALLPSSIAVCQSPDFTVVGYTTTTITVQNNGSAPATCTVFCEYWHTIERVFPNGAGVLSTTPVIVGETTVNSVARYVPNEMWVHNNVGPNHNLAMTCLVSPDFNTWRAPRAGSIVGLVARLDGAIVGGTMTVQVTKKRRAARRLHALVDRRHDRVAGDPSGGYRHLRRRRPPRDVVDVERRLRPRDPPPQRLLRDRGGLIATAPSPRPGRSPWPCHR